RSPRPGSSVRARGQEDAMTDAVTRERLISADSHVAVSLDSVRARVPDGLRAAFDDAIAASKRQEDELRGGRQLSLASWAMEAMRDPASPNPPPRLPAVGCRGRAAQARTSGSAASLRSCSAPGAGK